MIPMIICMKALWFPYIPMIPFIIPPYYHNDYAYESIVHWKNLLYHQYTQYTIIIMMMMIIIIAIMKITIKITLILSPMF